MLHTYRKHEGDSTSSLRTMQGMPTGTGPSMGHTMHSRTTTTSTQSVCNTNIRRYKPTRGWYITSKGLNTLLQNPTESISKEKTENKTFLLWRIWTILRYMRTKRKRLSTAKSSQIRKSDGKTTLPRDNIWIRIK